jgi:hypothetical protein
MGSCRGPSWRTCTLSSNVAGAAPAGIVGAQPSDRAGREWELKQAAMGR